MDWAKYQSTSIFMIIFAGLAITIFSFMPWFAIKTTLKTSVLPGWASSGNLTVVLGAICFLVGIAALKFKKLVLGIVAIVVSSATSIISIVALATASSTIMGASEVTTVVVRAQWGLYLAIAASLIAVVGGVMFSLKAKNGTAY